MTNNDILSLKVGQQVLWQDPDQEILGVVSQKGYNGVTVTFVDGMVTHFTRIDPPERAAKLKKKARP